MTHVLSASVHLSSLCLSSMFVLWSFLIQNQVNKAGPSGSWLIQTVVFYLVMKGLTHVRHVFHIHPKASWCLLNSFIMFIREHGGTKCRWVDFLLGNQDKKSPDGWGSSSYIPVGASERRWQPIFLELSDCGRCICILINCSHWKEVGGTRMWRSMRWGEAESREE